MCDRCHSMATGIRSGKGTGVLSKLLGLRACKHKKECECLDCQEYRSQNPYADFGLTGNRELKEL